MNPSIRYGVWAVLGLMLVGLLWSGVSRYLAEERAVAYAMEPPGEVAALPVVAPEPVATPVVEAPPVTLPEPPSVMVHVAGAVEKAGVYRFVPGARVADAIAAAGGALPDGDPDALNLAAPLADGDKVYVFTRSELTPNAPVPPAAQGSSHAPVTAVVGATGGSQSSGTAGPTGKVNINTATIKELEGVTGIGPVTATRIVEHRSQNGRYNRLEDLLKVKGIGAATLEKLRPHLTV